MASTIKVDTIQDQDGNNIINENADTITIGASGDTVAVAGNVVKTNAVQAADAGNLISQSGTTVTLGASGDTVEIASGATLVGGGTSWQSAKTGNFNAVAGEGYFVDTDTVGAVIATLPSSPSLGDEVTFIDQKYNFNTNALTVGRNGSNIANSASDLVVNTQGAGFTLVYSGDATVGWTYKDK